MKAKDLISLLSEVPPETEVTVETEDGEGVLHKREYKARPLYASSDAVKAKEPTLFSISISHDETLDSSGYDGVIIKLDQTALRAVGYLKCPISGKALSPTKVMQTLADDLGLTSTRPGSWEATNMQQVIDGHGWELNLGREEA